MTATILVQTGGPMTGLLFVAGIWICLSSVAALPRCCWARVIGRQRQREADEDAARNSELYRRRQLAAGLGKRQVRS
jgi:hypothetical protein